MKTPPRPRPASVRGFTLIELLVVVTIIAMLAAGAYGAYSIMLEKGKAVDARGAMTTVQNGITSFERDYDRLPNPTSATKGTDCETDTGSEENLIGVLKGLESSVDQNPRRTDYLGEIKEAKIVKDQKLAGLYRETEETIGLYDPWGSVYKMKLDLDGDGKLENPDTSAASGGSATLHKTVIIYSPGKDKDPMTWKDNVSSWQQ